MCRPVHSEHLAGRLYCILCSAHQPAQRADVFTFKTEALLTSALQIRATQGNLFGCCAACQPALCADAKVRQARAKAAAQSAARRGDLDAVIAQLEARQAAWRAAEAPPAPPARPPPAPGLWCAALHF